VGIREAVRVGAGRCEYRLLHEPEHEIDGSGGYEHVGDRLRPLSVGGRMRNALLHVQLGAEARREPGEKLRSLGLRRADLEMRSSRPAERARAEERTAEVGGRAAAASDDALWRAAEWSVRTVENAGPVEHCVCLPRAL